MVKFKTLWTHFPQKDSLKARCRNKQKDSDTPFDNYCAILLSECFLKSGVNMDGFKGTKCWSHDGKKHSLLADHLANWLAQNPPAGFGKKEVIPAKTFQKDLKGRTGVVFFKDYWQRGNESFERRSGDHIDLWNKDSITSGSMMYRAVVELFGFVSDLNKSKEVWFWEVK